MGVTMRTMTTVTGRSGKPERPSIFPIRVHLLTTCPQGRRCIPPVGRVVRSARRIALSAESARQCRSVSLPSLSVRLADGFRLVCPFAANRCPLLGQPAPACKNLPPAAFSRVWTDAALHRPFSFAALKETKPPLAGGRKEVKDYGDLSSGSKGREPWNRPLRLRGVGLSELQRHVQ